MKNLKVIELGAKRSLQLKACLILFLNNPFGPADQLNKYLGLISVLPARGFIDVDPGQIGWHFPGQYLSQLLKVDRDTSACITLCRHQVMVAFRQREIACMDCPAG